MNPGSVLFVGLGGAGQRHVRILRRRLPRARFFAWRRHGATPLLNPDFSVATGSLEETYGVTMVRRLEDGLGQQPELGVLLAPSSLHYEPMIAAASRGFGVLVEKPWSDSLAGFAVFREAVARA